jgi:sRNA-binding protein
MTRDNYTKATVKIDRINRINNVIEKLKREFPEFEYDVEAKELGNAIFSMLQMRLHIEQRELDEL